MHLVTYLSKAAGEKKLNTKRNISLTPQLKTEDLP